MRGDPVSSNEPKPRAPAELGIDARRNRRTALVALCGELELVTVSKVAEVLSDLEPGGGGIRHIVLDLRGLTFIDVPGLREADQAERLRLYQPPQPRRNTWHARHQRVLELTGVDESLVLVDDPDDLIPLPLDV
jgi:anti-anti-sigma factor